MRKEMVGVLVGLLVLALAVQVSAQQNINFNFAGQGARALGMGGAFIGIADDATAISWNPGGLGQLDRAELSTVGKFTMGKSSWDPSTVTQYGYTTKYPSASESHFVLNFASGAVPIKLGRNNLTFALAFQQQWDFYAKEEKDDTFRIRNNAPPFNVDTLTGTLIDKTTGGVYTISPGIAIQVIPQLSLGAAFNIWTGSPTNTFTRDLTSQPSSYNYQTHATIDWKDKMSYGGWNITFGALANVKPAKFGVVLRTPLSVSAHDNFTDKRDFQSRYWTSVSYFDVDTTWREPVSGNWKLKIPLSVGFGFSVNPVRNFTLAADYELRPLSSATMEDSAGTDLRTYGDTLDWPNSNQIRVGMEYLVMLGGGLLPLRAGFFTDPKTLRNVDMNSTSKGNQVTGFGFTFGSGFAVKHFQFDAAYGFNTASQKWTWDTGGSPTPPSSKSKDTRHNILASAIFKF